MISNILHWLRELIDFLWSLLNSFADFCSAIIGDIVNIATRCYVGLYNAVVDRFCTLVTTMVDSSGDIQLYIDEQSYISRLFYIADLFFDLKAGFLCVSTFLLFLVGFITVKFIIKLIPGIG